MSHIIKATIPAIQESFVQITSNFLQLMSQSKTYMQKTLVEVKSMDHILYDLGILIKPMKSKTAELIFDLKDNEPILQKYATLKHQNQVSPYLQCKIDEAFEILSKQQQNKK